MSIQQKTRAVPVARPLAAAVAIALSSLAHAQQATQAAPAADSARLEQVVVTANKRAQNLQDVPAAITVLNDAVLQRNNVRDVGDLPNLSPAVTVSVSTQQANNSINMRGIGTFSFGIGVESDVSVIVDDIPYAFQANAFKDLADAFRIEVLKGPQSTLLGKSSIAGAINITTKPIDGVWKNRVSTYLTNDGEWRASGSVSGPLSDTLRMRMAVSKSSFDGVVKNLANGERMNGSTSTDFVGKFEWAPDDNWQLTLSPHASRSNMACCVSPLTSMTPGGLYQNNTSLPASTLLHGINPAPGNVSVRMDYPIGGVARDKGAGLKVGYTFDDTGLLAKHNLSLITSWSNYHMADAQDGDATDYDVLGSMQVNGQPTGFHGGLYQYGTFDVTARTAELRLTSPDKGALKYVGGLWYAKNDLGRALTRAPVTSYVTDYSATAFNTNYAIFGQASYELTRATSLVAGLRLNKEDVGYTYTRYTPPPANPRSVTEYLEGNNGSSDKTGRLGLEHRLNPDAMAYLTYSTGHKGLAYDLTSSFNGAIAKTQPVPGENAHSVEAGLKLGLLDGKMSLDLAAFKTDFTGFQQSAGKIDDDGIFRTTLHSIGGLRTSGFEADLNWRVTRQLQLNGAMAYTKAVFTDFENGPCYNVTNAAGTGSTPGGNCAPNPNYGNNNVANLNGGTLPNAPKLKLNLGGQYDIPTDYSYNAFVTAAYRYQSATQFSLNQDPATIQGAYGILNLGLGAKDKQDKFKFTFTVNNVLNKSYAAGLGNSVAGVWSVKAPNTPLAVNQTTWTPPRDYQRYVAMRADFNF